jgi:opacity protein-like surface antigen
MKKIFLTIISLQFIIATMNAQFTKIGGGLTASTRVAWNNNWDYKDHRTGNPAITFDGIYEFSLPIHIAPSFTLFLPNVTKEDYGTYTYKTVVSSLMLDVDGHYVFNALDKFEFFGLAGLNITYISMKWVNEYEGEKSKSKESDNAFGLNVGAGLYFKLTDQFDIYGQAKYVVSKYDQVFFNAGVLINIDWLTKHEADADAGL